MVGCHGGEKKEEVNSGLILIWLTGTVKEKLSMKGYTMDSMSCLLFIVLGVKCIGSYRWSSLNTGGFL